MNISNSKKRYSLHVVVNTECNNNCIFCMETNAKKMHIPSLREAEKIFKKARRITDSILFTGPEPTVNSNLIKYIKVSKKCGFSEVRLVTNGRFLSYPKYAEDIFKAGLSEISVSLHSMDASVNNALCRTSEGFEQTVTACRNISKLKNRYKFQWHINITLTKLNLKGLKDFIKFVVSFGNVDKLVINTIIPQGRALSHFDKIAPKYSDIISTFKKMLFMLQKPGSLKQPVISLLGVPLCLVYKIKNFSCEYETILKNTRNKNILIKEGRRHIKIKRGLCRQCRLSKNCGGVWRNYIRKRGWGEFVPVK